MTFRQHQKSGNAHLGKGLGGILLLHGQDHQVRFGGDAGFQIKRLGGTNVGQVDQGGRGQLVDRALGGFILDSDHLVGQTQRDAGGGGNIVAADNTLGGRFQRYLPACHIGHGQGILDGGRSIGSLRRFRIAAGCHSSHHQHRQQQRQQFVQILHWNSSLLYLFAE